MDYMNLGVTSRKTGLRVRDDVARDEYNMENVDDFFKEDDLSLVTVRKKRRRSQFSPPGVTSVVGSPSTNEVPQISTPHIFSPAVGSLRRSLPPFEQTPSRGTNNLESIHEDEVATFDVDEYEDHQISPASNENRDIPHHDINGPSEQFNTTYDLGSNRKNTKPPIPQTAPTLDVSTQRQSNSYMESDVPDLVYDADLTIDNSPFNTSENAIPEDDVSNYGLSNSEYDSDSPSERISSGESSASSDVEDDDNYEAAANNSFVDKTYIPSDTGGDVSEQESEHQITNIEPLSYDRETISSDEDEEYMPPHMDTESSPEQDTIRRSNRIKVPPLEYWRNEKIVYKRRTSRPELDIEKIITFEPSEDSDSGDETIENHGGVRSIQHRTNISTSDNTNDESLQHNKSNNNVTQKDYRSINRAIISGQRNNETDGPNSQIYRNIEDGNVEEANWIKEGQLEGRINSSEDSYTKEILAYAPNVAQAERTKRTSTEKYTLSVMFDKHKDTFASGILKFPISGRRDITESQNAFITFYVIQGILEVTVATNKFIAPQGCSFQVPSFNQYSFANKGKEEAKMFFVQVLVPDDFNKHGMDAKQDQSSYTSDNSDSISDAEISQMVNLKDREIGNSHKSQGPTSVLQRLFVDSSSSDVTNIQRQ